MFEGHDNTRVENLRNVHVVGETKSQPGTFYVPLQRHDTPTNPFDDNRNKAQSRRYHFYYELFSCWVDTRCIETTSVRKLATEIIL